MTVNTRTTISAQRFLEYCFIIALFIPEYFKAASGFLGYIYWLLEAVRIVGSIYFIFYVFLNNRINQIFILCVIFQLTILFSTIINGSNLTVFRTFVNSAFPTLGIMAYIECRKNTEQLLMNFKVVLEFLLVINFIYMLAHPNGVYVTTVYNMKNDLSRDMMIYFLSFKNRLIMWVIPLAIILEIGKKEKKINLKEYFAFVIIMFITLCIARSITSIVALSLFYIGCICFEKNRIIKLTICKISIVYVVIFILFIYFNIQNFFSNLIVGVLGKNLLLQGRVYIWQIAVEMIREHFVIGYGNAGNGTNIQWNGYMWYAHNLALDILIQGGMIALSFMILIVLKLIRMERNIIKSNKRNYSKIQIVNIGLASFLTLGMFESYLNYPQFFMVIALTSIFMKPKYIKIVGKQIR